MSDTKKMLCGLHTDQVFSLLGLLSPAITTHYMLCHLRSTEMVSLFVRICCMCPRWSCQWCAMVLCGLHEFICSPGRQGQWSVPAKLLSRCCIEVDLPFSITWSVNAALCLLIGKHICSIYTAAPFPFALCPFLLDTLQSNLHINLHTTLLFCIWDEIRESMNLFCTVCTVLLLRLCSSQG